MFSRESKFELVPKTGSDSLQGAKHVSFCLVFLFSNTEVLHVQLLEHANSQNCFSDLLHGDDDACREFTKCLLRF